ncbi:XRE family transcriptional regulator [Clostridium sp. JN-9]|uniref:XRE family transcriptional regulator n=1 Tax=Clostridium sp. JN-9 TaxID=2507159 RepID=UPI000FFDF7BF|nr:XRE family transcriptional regulator [Clostridium sp. JN-9]QAT40873.1 XRE family transcriptional regulator [Clostridium sp. JN-9]
MQSQIKVNTRKFTELMKVNSLNKSDLAQKLNISRAQLWRVLNNKSNPGEQFIAGFKASFPNEEFDKFFLTCVLQESDTNST